jgi:hypothetical protein
MTMNTMKTLGIAAVTALSLGIGFAMAQEGGGPSMPTVDYWAARTIAVDRVAHAIQVQSGESDLTSPRGNLPAHFDYGDLANPG